MTDDMDFMSCGDEEGDEEGVAPNNSNFISYTDSEQVHDSRTDAYSCGRLYNGELVEHSSEDIGLRVPVVETRHRNVGQQTPLCSTSGKERTNLQKGKTPPRINVLQLLRSRETAAHSNCNNLRFWSRARQGCVNEVKRQLELWNERNSLLNESLKGKRKHRSQNTIQPCCLEQHPRSTIAAAFSSNGQVLASTQ